MLTGVDTGYPALNKLAGGGLQSADVIYLAARPSVGKTAFALNIGLNAMRSSKRTGVGFFSVEMAKDRITRRMLAAMSGVWMDSIKDGKMDVTEEQRVNRAMDELDKLPLFIDATTGISIQQLRSKARRMVLRDDVGLIMIDYVQLMTAQMDKYSNREQRAGAGQDLARAEGPGQGAAGAHPGAQPDQPCGGKPERE